MMQLAQRPMHDTNDRRMQVGNFPQAVHNMFGLGRRHALTFGPQPTCPAITRVCCLCSSHKGVKCEASHQRQRTHSPGAKYGDPPVVGLSDPSDSLDTAQGAVPCNALPHPSPPLPHPIPRTLRFPLPCPLYRLSYCRCTLRPLGDGHASPANSHRSGKDTACGHSNSTPMDFDPCKDF